MKRKVPYRVTKPWGDHAEDTILFLNYKDGRLTMISDELGNWFSATGIESALAEHILVPVDEDAPAEFELAAIEAEAARVTVQQAADRIIVHLERRPGLAEAVFRRLAKEYR